MIETSCDQSHVIQCDAVNGISKIDSDSNSCCIFQNEFKVLCGHLLSTKICHPLKNFQISKFEIERFSMFYNVQVDCVQENRLVGDEISL